MLVHVYASLHVSLFKQIKNRAHGYFYFSADRNALASFPWAAAISLLAPPGIWVFVVVCLRSFCVKLS